VLPSLTLCTHTLLALSFLLPGSDPTRAVFSITYNAIAGSASILGLVGAIRVSKPLSSSPRFVRLAGLGWVRVRAEESNIQDMSETISKIKAEMC